MLFEVTEDGCVAYTVNHISEHRALDHVREWSLENGGEEDATLEVEAIPREKEVPINFEGIGKITHTAEEWAAIYDGRHEIIACSEW